MESQKKIVVTGAAGFLGGRIVKFLAKNFTDHQIIATSRRTTRSQELQDQGCLFISGDLTNQEFCNKLTKDAVIVVHCAALSSPYGTYDLFYQSNYIATDNLLKISVAQGVQKFIFISTPSIYFNYVDRYAIKESDPLPPKLVNNYAKTKLLAEEKVLTQNGKGIATIALRPRAIIGAEDTVILPRVLEAYHQKKLKIVGDGKNSCDFTCAQNVIEAVLCCLKAESTAYGQAYNITDGDPVVLWDVLNYLLTSLDLEPITKKVPKKIALFAASIIERKARLLTPKKEPALTQYGIGVLAANFTLDISKAKETLHYTPVMTTTEGINEYIAWHKTK